MSKPWERNWKLDDSDPRKAIADAEDGSTLFEQGMWCSDGDMTLAIAAPDMAREPVSALRSKSDLVKTQEGQRMRLWLTVEQVQAMADAVRKAGVPL